MKNFNEPHSGSEERAGYEAPAYQKRHRTGEASGEKKRWLIPLALLLILIAGISIFWFIGSRSQSGLFQRLMANFSPPEIEVKIILPSALFAGQDIEEVTARAIEEQGVDEIVPGDDNTLIYTMSPEVRDKLLEEAAHDLELKITTLKESRIYPYVVDLSYDSSFTEFYLVVDRDREQDGNALTAAAELFVLAVYYQHIIATEGTIHEVSISIEDTENGGVRERLVYPGDLERVAAVLERTEEPDLTPATPAAGDKVIVSTGPDNLNLRNGPDITYLIIDILRSGTVLDVIGTEDVWLEVITPDQKEGWVHGNYVELLTEDN